MQPSAIPFLIATFLPGGDAPTATVHGAPVRSLEVLSKAFHIDRIYRSMMGPMDLRDVRLAATAPDELLWIVGYRAAMVGDDGVTPMPAEFMCHSNLDLDVARHHSLFGGEKDGAARMFTLSQGQTDVTFPEGFGLPVLGGESLALQSQVLNLNVRGQGFTVRQRVTIDFVRDRDVTRPMQPLFLSAANGLVLLDGDTGHFNVADPDAQVHGPGCMPGGNAGSRVIEDEFGRRFSGHWVVPPGRQENRTPVTEFMRVPFDTTIHHIAVHLHPFAESLALVDRTTGRTLFKSHARNLPDRIGLAEVESWSSAAGIPVFADHEYELISVYDNTTEVDQDSMAVMFLYLLDREFAGPERLAGVPAPALGAATAGTAALALLGLIRLRRRRAVAQSADPV